MIRKCARCGQIKNGADMSAAETCPSCGVVFSKATIAQAQEQQRARVTERIERSPSNARPGLLEQFGWALTVLGSVTGIIQLSITELSAESAPQQAAGAGLAIASAVIPYCLARAFQISLRK